MRLPEPVDAAALLSRAREEGIAYLPGSYFAVSRQADPDGIGDFGTDRGERVGDCGAQAGSCAGDGTVLLSNGERRMAKHPYCPLSNCPRSFVPRLAQACAETGSGSSQARNWMLSTREPGISQPGGNAAGVRGIGRAGARRSRFRPAALVRPGEGPSQGKNLKVPLNAFYFFGFRLH